MQRADAMKVKKIRVKQGDWVEKDNKERWEGDVKLYHYIPCYKDKKIISV